MATKLSSLRSFEVKRFGYGDIYEYIWSGGRTHKIIKKPKKVILLPLHPFPKINKYGKSYINISRGHKVFSLLKDKILPSSYIYTHLKSLEKENVKILIGEIFGFNSPVNTRSIVISHVMRKFYERRDLINSLESRANLTKSIPKAKI